MKPFVSAPIDELLFHGYVDPMLSVLDVVKKVPGGTKLLLSLSPLLAGVLPMDRTAFFYGVRVHC